MTEANLPAHRHSILYNSSGDKGGIWGVNNINGGNYGNGISGEA